MPNTETAAYTRHMLGMDAMSAHDVALTRISRAIQKDTGRTVDMANDIARVALLYMGHCGVVVSFAPEPVA